MNSCREKIGQWSKEQSNEGGDGLAKLWVNREGERDRERKHRFFLDPAMKQRKSRPEIHVGKNRKWR
jgi:hypothetical protein